MKNTSLYIAIFIAIKGRQTSECHVFAKCHGKCVSDWQIAVRFLILSRIRKRRKKWKSQERAGRIF